VSAFIADRDGAMTVVRARGADEAVASGRSWSGMLLPGNVRRRRAAARHATKAARVNLEEELDRLYGLPLAEFTPGRNALAGALRRAGERDAADRVQGLRKPSISAWTVNQLARKERLQVRSLLTAGERLRKAQEELLRGGNRDELQEASARQREVVRALLKSAAEVLHSAGHPATDSTLERIRGTLSSAAGDEGTRLVQEGRLTEDLDPSGFGPPMLGTGAGSRPSRGAKSVSARGKSRPAPGGSRREDGAARKRRIEEAKQEVDELRAEVSERRTHVSRARTEARRAERAAEAAKGAAEKEEKQLEQLTARLEAAKEALARARSGSRR
jgi:hypothetical protein